MLCVYYQPRKCVHLRYGHLELILQIMQFLGGMLALQVTICFLFRVKMMSDILAIYHRELFPNTSCLLTIGTHLCVVEIIDHLHVGVCFLLPYLLPRIVSTPFVFHTTCGSCLFLDLVQCFLDIVKVVIPPRAFCIQMQILYNALVLGELSYSL